MNWFPPKPPSTPARTGLTPREASLVKDIIMFGDDDASRLEEEDTRREKVFHTLEEEENHKKSSNNLEENNGRSPGRRDTFHFLEEEDDEDVCIIEGDVNTTRNWFGFIANLTMARDGWFHFVFTYPYDMQVQNVLMYERSELQNLHWDQTCFEKELVIPQLLVPQKILDLSFR